MHPLRSLLLTATLFLLSSAAQSVDFNNVVSLGDSLMDDPGGNRSPLVSDQIATRLGVPLTKLAVGGSTSTSLIAGNQHTDAAANFGSGDLAVVWIGGNDFLDAALAIVAGNLDFLDTLESNMDQVFSTLRAADIEVVAFNLPDISQVPGVVLQISNRENLRTATIEWRERLNALAEVHGVTIVDVFSTFDMVTGSPASFAIDGNEPIASPTFGDVFECPYCTWFDEIHPSAAGQGIITNAAVTRMNAAYDVSGIAPLARVSDTEFASLASVETFLTIAGLWYDPDFAGEGYDVVQTASGTTIFYYGYDANGERLWLISNTVSARLALNSAATFDMKVGDDGGDFSQPIPSSELSPWGTLTVTLTGCGTGMFDLEGRDGNKSHDAVKLAGVAGTSCIFP